MVMVANPSRSGDVVPLDDLDARVAVLEARLRAGEEKIHTARLAGRMAEARRYERVWDDILQSYERLCDEISRRRATAAVGEEPERATRAIS
jgi:hypothetical protein